MKIKFNVGSELDKEIYNEGEPTWGCKSGVLDVEDVKKLVKVVENIIIRREPRRLQLLELKKNVGESLI